MGHRVSIAASKLDHLLLVRSEDRGDSTTSVRSPPFQMRCGAMYAFAACESGFSAPGHPFKVGEQVESSCAASCPSYGCHRYIGPIQKQRRVAIDARKVHAPSILHNARKERDGQAYEK